MFVGRALTGAHSERPATRPQDAVRDEKPAAGERDRETTLFFPTLGCLSCAQGEIILPMSTAASPRSFGVHCTLEVARRWKWVLLLIVVAVGLVDLWALSNWRATVDPTVHGSLLIELGSPSAGGWQKVR